jgi:predicted RNA binding protein YcfA (HicA-like mRNA interferase family)
MAGSVSSQARILEVLATLDPLAKLALVPPRGNRFTYDKLARVDKHEELRRRLLQGESDANIDFEDLRRVLAWLGFEERVRGSHHIFRKPGVRELINLQKEGNKAKVYQVRQVRRVMLRYGLVGPGR